MASRYVRYYLLQGLEATPIVMDRLLSGISEEWLDLKPDPERFTMREVIAHLAEWEGIWLQRIQLICAQENPLLVSYDEEQLAIDHDYAHTDMRNQLAKFQLARTALCNYLARLSEEEWTRVGIREGHGAASVFDLSTLVLGHDGYHLRQVAEYVGAQGA